MRGGLCRESHCVGGWLVQGVLRSAWWREEEAEGRSLRILSQGCASGMRQGPTGERQEGD